MMCFDIDVVTKGNPTLKTRTIYPQRFSSRTTEGIHRLTHVYLELAIKLSSQCISDVADVALNVLQDELIHRQLCADTDSVYRLSCHPLYLLLAKLLLISCKEFLGDLQVCFR